MELFGNEKETGNCIKLDSVTICVKIDEMKEIDELISFLEFARDRHISMKDTAYQPHEHFCIWKKDWENGMKDVILQTTIEENSPIIADISPYTFDDFRNYLFSSNEQYITYKNIEYVIRQNNGKIIIIGEKNNDFQIYKSEQDFIDNVKLCDKHLTDIWEYISMGKKYEIQDIKIAFKLTGYKIDLNYISDLLEITPTKTEKKAGEVFEWTYEVRVNQSISVCEKTDEFVQNLNKKTDKINNLLSEFENLVSCIIITSKNNYLGKFCLSQNLIDFANKINSNIWVD